MAPAPFDWYEYLRLARTLSTNADEASQRTSISRAYYFVYHIASAQAIANGYPPGEGAHQKLWAYYQKDANKDARRLAALGHSMKRVRESADYKAVIPQIPDQMTQQLTDADKFLEQINRLPPGSPPRP